jgi:hypothetical protein
MSVPARTELSPHRTGSRTLAPRNSEAAAARTNSPTQAAKPIRRALSKG